MCVADFLRTQPHEKSQERIRRFFPNYLLKIPSLLAHDYPPLPIRVVYKCVLTSLRLCVESQSNTFTNAASSSRHNNKLEDRVVKLKHQIAELGNDLQTIRKGTNKIRKENIHLEQDIGSCRKSIKITEAEMQENKQQCEKLQRHRTKIEESMQDIRHEEDNLVAEFELGLKVGRQLENKKLVHAAKQMTAARSRRLRDVKKFRQNKDEIDKARKKAKILGTKTTLNVAYNHVKVHSQEEAMERLMELTGIRDLDALVTEYIKSEDRQLSLVKTLNNLHDEVALEEAKRVDLMKA